MKYLTTIISLALFCSVNNSELFAAAPINVYVSIPPQEWVVQEVGGTLVKTDVVLGKGQDPHTFEPSPRQLTGLVKADLYFTAGMTFEKHITEKLDQSGSGPKIVDMVQDVNKIPMSDHDHDDHDGHDDHEDHGKHEGHDDHEDHGKHEGHDDHEDHGKHEGHDDHAEEHGHGTETLDPHVWLDPENLLLMTKTVAETLMSIDPANRATYEKNQAAAAKKLRELDSEITRILAPFEGSAFFVYHPSFGYFAKRYNLQQQAIEIEGKSPSPRQLRELIIEAKERGAKVLFVQPQFDQKSGQAIAQAIGGKVVPLDPLEADVYNNLKDMALSIKQSLE